MLFMAHYTSNFVLSVLFFALQQIIVGWQSHSEAHSRHPTIIRLGAVHIPLI
jgi:hypothetical protein